MINQLYNLKKTQTDQVIAQKAEVESKIDSIDAEILLTENQLNIATVSPNGAISDFTILTMHKNTMRHHIAKLEQQKQRLSQQAEKLMEEIIELQKESEQFAYLLEEEKKEAIKKLLLAEEEASNEYMQMKYITG